MTVHYDILRWASETATLTPSGAPSWPLYIIGVLVSFALLLLMFQFQGERERRRHEAENHDKTEQSIALINQALAVLVSQIAPVSSRIEAHDIRLNGLEQSAALLKQALETHMLTSELDRKRLNQNYDSLRDGLRDGAFPASDRRRSPRPDDDH